MCENPSRENVRRKGGGQVAGKSISAMHWINNRSRGSEDKKRSANSCLSAWESKSGKPF